MKKLMYITMMAFVLMLAACGSSNTGTEAENEGESASIEEKKTLRIVTDAAYAPMEYLEGDKVVGFDIDLIKAVTEEAGYEAEIVHVGWDPIFVEIEGKTADLAISSITINDDRKQTYDFSVPYYLSTNKILVPADSEVKSGADLKDKIVAVQNGTTGQEVAEAILGVNSPNVKKFENNNLAIQELLSGGADAVIADNTVVEYYAKMNPDKNLTVLTDDSFDAEYYGVMFPKGSELAAEYDKAINAIFENGKYAEIYKEWFGAEPDVESLKAQQ
ncbi:basic amino acid ABC transporter substrate-binding protein [Bacillus dakarensis]|uniref:basic amino acid ABC transporter substrate-binding protein n=1 Tax=Robertmurraya dakarensis TaxID=1926278 RepID=UPI00098123A1|nr:basic amino acid ABC transporter substrate-binding protein [Bacillus dakarensis]